jgi:two-component sensor histidine kinase
VVRQLANRIQSMLPEGYVAISVEGDEVACPSKEATALSVIANELVTNAIKHGAPGSDGCRRVDVRLLRRGTGVSLTVWNSGNPVPAAFDPGGQRGVGLSLVRDLVVGQWQGAFTLEPRDSGTLARIEFSERCLRGAV